MSAANGMPAQATAKNQTKVSFKQNRKEMQESKRSETNLKRNISAHEKSVQTVSENKPGVATLGLAVQAFCHQKLN